LQRICLIPQEPVPNRPEPIRAATPFGAALHSASVEDRQTHHHRLARQDRNDGILFADPASGRAIPEAVSELAERLEAPEVEGIQRRGIILAFLTRFKQICNHPSQWLGDGVYAPAESGKFNRLRELCDEIASRQEKVL